MFLLDTVVRRYANCFACAIPLWLIGSGQSEAIHSPDDGASTVVKLTMPAA